MLNNQSCLQLFKHDADSILPDSNMNNPKIIPKNT